MEIDTRDAASPLIKTDVVEAFKGSATNALDPMIRDEEVLLPPHEQVVSIEVVAQRERCGTVLRISGQGLEGRETSPMCQIDLFGTVPRRVGCAEEMLGADDFAFEESGQGRMVIRQAWLDGQLRVSKSLQKALTNLECAGTRTRRTPSSRRP